MKSRTALIIIGAFAASSVGGGGVRHRTGRLIRRGDMCFPRRHFDAGRVSERARFRV